MRGRRLVEMEANLTMEGLFCGFKRKEEGGAAFDSRPPLPPVRSFTRGGTDATIMVCGDVTLLGITFTGCLGLVLFRVFSLYSYFFAGLHTY